MTNYEELRRSFDNILKELDDICKSIDDLTDFEQNFHIRTNRSNNQAVNNNKVVNNNSSSDNNPIITTSGARSPRTNRIYERYKKQFSLDQQVKNSGGGGNTRPLILPTSPQNKPLSEESSVKQKEPTPIPSSSKQRSSSSSRKKHHHHHNHRSCESTNKKSNIPLLNSVIGSAANFFLSSTSDVSGSMSSPRHHDDYATTNINNRPDILQKSERTEEHNERDYNQSNTNHNHNSFHNHHHHNHHNHHQNHGHQDQDRHQPSHEYLLPLDIVGDDATTRQHHESVNNNHHYNRHYHHHHHQNNEGITNGKDATEEQQGRTGDDYINILVNNEAVVEEVVNNSEINNNNNDIDNDDYLKGSELAKIECFYSSMGCYVYVGRCIAELYQIKREDEFDHMDSDPVDDYREFMKMKRRQWRRENNNGNQNGRRKQFAANKFNRLFMSLNETTSSNRNDDVFPNESSSDTEESSSTNVKSGSVNYMYINSGVPVIVFNYGANPKRNKDLRIVLAERSTGFCLWEFKFDRLTQFENSDEMTVIRLSLNQQQQQQQQQQANLLQPTPPAPPSTGHSIFSSMLSHIPFSPSSSSSSGSNQIAYHNEYFERFFNAAKNQRQAQKEYLIKFVIKRDCDEFCYKLSRIMNDKRNSDLFINENLEAGSSNLLRGTPLKSFYQSNQSLNSINSSVSAAATNQAQLSAASAQQPKSSVIICHFDFFNYELNYDANSLAASFTKKEKPSALLSATSNAYNYENGGNNMLGEQNTLPNMPKSAIKASSRLVRQHSSSSANILPSTPNRTGSNKPGLIRYDSLRSNNDAVDLETTSLSGKKPASLNNEMKQLSGSVINLTSNTTATKTAADSASNASSSSTTNRIKTLLVKYKKLKKSDISSPLNFNHVTHLDKPVPIGKRYKIDYC